MTTDWELAERRANVEMRSLHLINQEGLERFGHLVPGCIRRFLRRRVDVQARRAEQALTQMLIAAPTLTAVQDTLRLIAPPGTYRRASATGGAGLAAAVAASIPRVVDADQPWIDTVAVVSPALTSVAAHLGRAIANDDRPAVELFWDILSSSDRMPAYGHRGPAWRPPPSSPGWIPLLATAIPCPRRLMRLDLLAGAIVPAGPVPEAEPILAALTDLVLQEACRLPGTSDVGDNASAIALARWVAAGHERQAVVRAARDAFVLHPERIRPEGVDALLVHGLVTVPELAQVGQLFLDFAVCHLDAGGAQWLAQVTTPT